MSCAEPDNYDESADRGEQAERQNDTQGDQNSEDQEADDRDSNGCNFEDGLHNATVDYYNPETGTSNTYSLTVNVSDCEVTVIYFPKGGWLDGTHISPTELEEDGETEIEDDQGREWHVHIYE